MKHVLTLLALACLWSNAHADTLIPSNDRQTVTWSSPLGQVTCHLPADQTVLARHTTGIISPDGRWTLTQNAPASGLTLWHNGQPNSAKRLLEQAPLWQDLRPFAYLGFFAAFSDNGRWLALSHGDGIISVLNTATGVTIWQKKVPPAYSKNHLRFFFTADGGQLVWFVKHANSNTATLNFFEVATGQLVRELTVTTDLTWAHETVALSRDGLWFAIASGTQVDVYNVATQRLMRSFGPFPYLVNVQFSADAKALLVQSGYLTSPQQTWGEVAVYNLQTGLPLLELEHEPRTYLSMGLSPDGQTLALEANDSERPIWLYDVASGERLLTAPKCSDW